jgi:hypothetical protein
MRIIYLMHLKDRFHRLCYVQIRIRQAIAYSFIQTLIVKNVFNA